MPASVPAAIVRNCFRPRIRAIVIFMALNIALHLWLPKSADWYSSLSDQRYHRRHTFTHFLLFSVDDFQKIGKPKEPTDEPPKDPIAQAPPVAQPLEG